MVTLAVSDTSLNPRLLRNPKTHVPPLSLTSDVEGFRVSRVPETEETPETLKIWSFTHTLFVSDSSTHAHTPMGVEADYGKPETRDVRYPHMEMPLDYHSLLRSVVVERASTKLAWFLVYLSRSRVHHRLYNKIAPLREGKERQ